MASTVTLSRWGNAQGIRIPKAMCEQLDIAPGDRLEITVIETEIRLSKVEETPRNLADLFEGYEGDYRPSEWELGEAVGGEMW